MVRGIVIGSAITAVVSYLLLLIYPSRRCYGAPPAIAPAWNLHSRLGGYGPYMSKVEGIISNTSLPHGCEVQQVHMLARHSERFPTINAGTRMIHLWHRLDKAGVRFNGSLDFVNTWDFFTSDPGRDFEQLTVTGPHAGSKTAFDLGVRLKTRYSKLLEKALRRDRPISFWASDSQRVIETARYFATAFFGLDWMNATDLHIVSEAADQGADTLTPGETCVPYVDEDSPVGWNYGAAMAQPWKDTYLEPIVKRLQQENPGYEWRREEVYVMQELCGFETMASGSSPWCAVFTREEWKGYEYARDLLHYYRSGPGNQYAAVMGWLWLNATAHLLEQGPTAGELFFSFVHDGDIVPMLAALDLFPQEILPASHIVHTRRWRTSDVVPMGANIIFEALSCPLPKDCWSNAPMYPNHIYCSPQEYEQLVRIKLNDGAVALPGCDHGAGRTCPLPDFLARVKQKGKELGSFAEICDLPVSAPNYLNFLHQ